MKLKTAARIHRTTYIKIVMCRLEKSTYHSHARGVNFVAYFNLPYHCLAFLKRILPAKNYMWLTNRNRNFIREKSNDQEVEKNTKQIKNKGTIQKNFESIT